MSQQMPSTLQSGATGADVERLQLIKLVVK
jgi:hypothetical protein